MDPQAQSTTGIMPPLMDGIFKPAQIAGQSQAAINPANAQTPPAPPVTPPPPAANPIPPPASTLSPTPAAASNPAPLESKGAGQPAVKTKQQKASAQDTIMISEIRDGLVIMRDGSFRAVVMCQSINFDLMSPQEREGVELSYQGFLNSLYFPIQIFIRSQRVDLNSYIEKLEQIHTNQENILLGLLMEDYIAYVRYLIEAANIMDKQFYVVIPYYPPLRSQEGISGGLRRVTSLFKPKAGPVVINETDLNKYKAELTQRVQVVLDGMNQLNVQAVPLSTQELIELYYTTYNPQTAANERLTNIAELEAPIVGKGKGPAASILPGETTK